MTHPSPMLTLRPLAVGVALMLASCAHREPEPPTQPPAAGLGAPAAPAAVLSQAKSLAGYKAEVARRVYETNAQQVFTGQPPPLLRSIVVVSVVIDEHGNVLSTKIYRDNGDAETRGIALASLKRAAPLPRPTRAVLRGRQVEYLESWLFRRDGKFQVRSLAELQASE
jgi:periplasmic protein TonB